MMDRAGAIAALASPKVDERLAAARYLWLNPSRRDIARLLAAVEAENVPWVKRALARAVDAARAKPSTSDALAPAAPPPLAQPELSDQQVWDLKARAVEEVAGTVLHEFSAIVGALRVKAPSEIRAFSASGTAKLLDQLSELIEAVRNLKKAAAVANLTQFDLAELVAEAIDAVEGRGAFEFSVAGERPFLVKADRHTLRLALLNGIRNAVESLQQFTRVDPGTIVVNWGRAGVEDWLVIVDSGAGFQGDPSAALGLGITNKRDHIGYGLATAQYAMRSMGGDVLLANDLSGGARFELRWYSNNEDTVR